PRRPCGMRDRNRNRAQPAGGKPRLKIGRSIMDSTSCSRGPRKPRTPTGVQRRPRSSVSQPMTGGERSMAERAPQVEAGADNRTDFSLLIGGALVGSDDHLDVINPATGKVFASAPAASRTQLDDAVRAARAAFETWRTTSFAHRAELVRAFAQQLRERQNELAELLTREQGKPLSQSIAEIDRGAAQSDGM